MRSLLIKALLFSLLAFTTLASSAPIAAQDQDPPLIERGPAGADGTKSVSISFYGKTAPPVNTEAVLVCSTLGINQNATCTSVTRELAVGEVIKGTAEFTLSTTP